MILIISNCNIYKLIIKIKFLVTKADKCIVKSKFNLSRYDRSLKKRIYNLYESF